MLGLLIFFILTSVASGFVIFNLHSQVVQLEKFVTNYNKREQKLYLEVENYYKIFLEIFTDAYTQMQRIDKRGSFSSDDEVGFSFKAVANAISEIKFRLEALRKTEDEEQ